MSQHLKTRLYKSILLSIVFSLAGVTIALAASGGLDNTFSSNGWARTDFAQEEDGVKDIAIQPDGKIVAAGHSGSVFWAGDFALARYTTDGRLDKTFSGNGRVRTDFGGYDIAYGIVVQSDGKLVVAGQTCTAGDEVDCDAVLARYTPTGKLDPTFGQGGKVVTKIGTSSNNATALAIQPDGKIVVCGRVFQDQPLGWYYTVQRYLPNGRLDSTFSGDGKVRIQLRSFGSLYFDEGPTALTIQPSNGKIVVVGNAWDLSRPDRRHDLAVVRLNPNGSLDTTFSGNGIVRTDFFRGGESGDDAVYAVALQPDGKIVVVGETNAPNSPYRDGAIVRYNSNGTLDQTFGRRLPNGHHTGTKIIDIGLGSEPLTGLVVQPDGKLVMTFADFDRWFLLRLQPSGAFDPSLQGKGFVRIPLSDHYIDYQLALAKQPSDGKYVMGASVHTLPNTPPFDFLIARVLP
jgi:uncharacterized delta-60 repeat protein